MIRFQNPEYFYALAALPGIAVLYVLASLWRKRALSRFGDLALLSKLLPDVSRWRPILKLALALSATLLLVLGIVNPQIGTKLEEVKREGVDIIIALDVSNSMRAEDITPERLQRAKGAIARLIDRLRNDRIGLIVFAGEAFVMLPLTADYAAAKLFLSSVDTDIVSKQGTAIGASIKLARDAFESEETKFKALIIITDGENHEDDAVSEAAEAHKEGVVIHAIGMGSPEGVPIPLYLNGSRRGYRKDRQGNVIVTKLNEAILRQIAGAANGTYVRASSSDAGLDTILDKINTMEKKEFGTREYSDFEDRFQWFLMAAFILLLLEFLISQRRSKWLDGVTLFKGDAQ